MFQTLTAGNNILKAKYTVEMVPPPLAVTFSSVKIWLKYYASPVLPAKIFSSTAKMRFIVV